MIKILKPNKNDYGVSIRSNKWVSIKSLIRFLKISIVLNPTILFKIGLNLGFWDYVPECARGVAQEGKFFDRWVTKCAIQQTIQSYRKENEYVYVAFASLSLITIALVGKAVNNLLLLWVSQYLTGNYPFNEDTTWLHK